MQTIPTNEGAAVSGSTQTPLLLENQLEPGVFITGNTMQNVWRVESVDLAAGTVMLQKVPNLVTVSDNHTHIFSLHQNTTCACGLRRQTIRGDATGLLPLRPNTPRVYVIRPVQALVMPDTFTVYLTARGAIVTMDHTGHWSATLPLVPALFPVWSLPEALRSRVRHSDGEIVL